MDDSEFYILGKVLGQGCNNCHLTIIDCRGLKAL